MYNNSMKDDSRPISRRRLFKDGLNFLGQVAGELVEAARIDEDDIDEGVWDPLEPKRGLLRPPGAVKELDFNRLCDRCDDCLRACPEDVLFHAPAKHGPAQGTPIFRPTRKPCYLCTELYCIKACKTSALVMVDKIERLAMGVARLDSSRCRAHEGEDCSYCIDYCPLSGKAIIQAGGRPLIVSGECIGCGQCEYHCLFDAGRRAITTLAPPLDGPER